MKSLSLMVEFPDLLGLYFKKEGKKGEILFPVKTSLNKLHFFIKKNRTDFLIFFFPKKEGVLIRKIYCEKHQKFFLFNEKFFENFLKKIEKESLKEAKKILKKPYLLSSKILQIKLDEVLLSDPFGIPFKKIEIEKMDFYLPREKYLLFMKILKKIKIPAKIFIKEVIYEGFDFSQKNFENILDLRFKNLENLFKIKKEKIFLEVAILTSLFLEGKGI